MKAHHDYTKNHTKAGHDSEYNSNVVVDTTNYSFKNDHEKDDDEENDHNHQTTSSTHWRWYRNRYRNSNFGDSNRRSLLRHKLRKTSESLWQILKVRLIMIKFIEL